MKRLIGAALPFLRLLLTQLLILAAVCAAPDVVSPGGAGGLGRCAKAVVSEGGKDDASGGISRSRIDLSRSRTSSITITKIKPLAKTFGYLPLNSSLPPVSLLLATISYEGGTPSHLHTPVPAGRSP